MNEHAKIPLSAARPRSPPARCAGSRKVYAAPQGRPDILVPFKEVVLTDSAEPPVRI